MKRLAALFFPLLVFAVMLAGCSSSKETGKTERPKVESKEPPRPVAIKNIEFEERKLISSEKIKTVDKIQFDFNARGKLVNGRKTSQVIYNPQGFSTEAVFYNRSGKTDNKYEYKYDGKGFRIETIRYNSAGKPDKRYTYEYNKYGNKIKALRYNITGKLEKYYVYQYDEYGNLINDLWYNFDGTLEYKILNTYNSNNQKIEADGYNQDDDLVDKVEYQYDKKGNVIEEIHYDSSGRKTGITQYVYRYY